MNSAGENDWSDDDGETWQSVPEMWSADVVRFDDRFALIGRRASGPVVEVSGDGAAPPRGLIGGEPMGAIGWDVTSDGRLFGSGIHQNYFLLSDGAWQQVSRVRLPHGFSDALLIGSTVYAVMGDLLVISHDLGRRYDRPINLNTLKPSG